MNAFEKWIDQWMGEDTLKDLDYEESLKVTAEAAWNASSEHIIKEAIGTLLAES
jgi:hypothetical protein